MKKINRFLFLIPLLLIHTHCAKSSVAPKDIQIISTATANPVLVGLATNPVVSIIGYVPAGNPTIMYQTIHGTINADAIADIQKVEVYFTGIDPTFSTANLVGSVSPAISFDIPIALQLSYEVNHIWLSVTLKQAANTNHKVELHVTQLTNTAGKPQKILEVTGWPFAKYMGMALRRAGDDGVNTYRIPGIATTDQGTLIAVYDVRYDNSNDLPANINVGMSRSTDGGRTWNAMKIIMDMGTLPNGTNGVGDPTILFDPATKKLWVAALWSKGNHSIAGSGPGLTPDVTGQFMLVSSSDDGLTWSTPYSITSQVKDPAWRIFFQGPGTGSVMSNGTLVFPAQYWDASGMPYSTIIYSDDHGVTWKRGTGAKSNTTESAVVETTPGTLMLNMRDNRGSFRSVATSPDMGNSWTEDATSYSALPDPVCMGSMIKASVLTKGVQKEIIFFSNPNVSSAPRRNITIKASLDLGESWLPANQLLIDERPCYGYSALTKIDNNTLGFLYEGTKELYFVRIPVSDIVK